ncbi:S-adenosyl-L-methionine-dependent methyltransferase [Dunaliella salina]|uniref:S-adenosyl-L-methionine-dependent methyltransferase n=1 Tax=Dunaliella salina TaxID=3046 RepID=A0ABQ7GI10_DUNSA|nr:S-adenosyl-L-methionine-dependent methyltransferase [Dunaliella salina]|eukprot:KAF5834256.1 S-adenosyl-L-methionine-dependent methyltransferase [Dunaliella salina]
MLSNRLLTHTQTMHVQRPSIQTRPLSPMRRNQITRGATIQQQKPNCRNRGSTILAGSLPKCGCPACGQAAQSSGQQPSLYQRYFAQFMANSVEEYESAAHPWKVDLFSRLVKGRPTQRIVEVGVGTGPNFKYLAAAHREQHGQEQQVSSERQQKEGQQPNAELQGLEIVGCDPNTAMQPYAKQAAVDAGLNGAVSLLQGRAEELPLESDSFDAAVVTLVLCSVRDPPRAIDEVLRVLKPQGRLLFLEHVAASWETQPLLRAQQALWSPIHSVLADNCHLTRDTKRVIAEKRSNFSDLMLIEENLPGMGLVSPHIRGIAVK